ACPWSCAPGRCWRWWPPPGAGEEHPGVPGAAPCACRGAGRVLLDGHPLPCLPSTGTCAARWPPSPQEPVVFSPLAPRKHRLRAGGPGAGRKVTVAARRAGAHAFVTPPCPRAMTQVGVASPPIPAMSPPHPHHVPTESPAIPATSPAMSLPPPCSVPSHPRHVPTVSPPCPHPPPATSPLCPHRVPTASLPHPLQCPRPSPPCPHHVTAATLPRPQLSPPCPPLRPLPCPHHMPAVSPALSPL
ncbi:unnamed protein product, partial [Bubo scandiacus]